MPFRRYQRPAEDFRPDFSWGRARVGRLYTKAGEKRRAEVSNRELIRWEAAIRTLATLHSITPSSIGLSTFGKPSDFYPRQLKTWSTICEAQSAVRDVDSGKPVGPLPRMEDLVGYFADGKKQPVDRCTLVHGDFKIDNLVFHKTEPRVIGILE